LKYSLTVSAPAEVASDFLVFDPDLWELILFTDSLNFIPCFVAGLIGVLLSKVVCKWETYRLIQRWLQQWPCHFNNCSLEEFNRTFIFIGPKNPVFLPIPLGIKVLVKYINRLLNFLSVLFKFVGKIILHQFGKIDTLI